MSVLAKIVSAIALGLVIVPSLMLYVGTGDLPLVKLLALVGTVGWFLSTPLWLGRSAATEDAPTS